MTTSTPISMEQQYCLAQRELYRLFDQFQRSAEVSRYLHYKTHLVQQYMNEHYPQFPCTVRACSETYYRRQKTSRRVALALDLEWRFFVPIRQNLVNFFYYEVTTYLEQVEQQSIREDESPDRRHDTEQVKLLPQMCQSLQQTVVPHL